jgi:hypothetical protein
VDCVHLVQDRGFRLAMVNAGKKLRNSLKAENVLTS